jgi:hypothetical protein
VKEIPLTRGKFAIIDDEYFEELNKFKWQASTTGYARRSEFLNGKRKYVSMHRSITDAKAGEMVDHINGNRLDNRRCNLRVCNNSQNQMNSRSSFNGKSSKYKGVCKFQPKGRRKIKWMASIGKDGKKKTLGYYDTEIAAAHAYNQAAKELFGEFALLNDIYN